MFAQMFAQIKMSKKNMQNTYFYQAQITGS
jgi:hypothetical protein